MAVRGCHEVVGEHVIGEWSGLADPIVTDEGDIEILRGEQILHLADGSLLRVNLLLRQRQVGQQQDSQSQAVHLGGSHLLDVFQRRLHDSDRAEQGLALVVDGDAHVGGVHEHIGANVPLLPGIDKYLLIAGRKHGTDDVYLLGMVVKVGQQGVHLVFCVAARQQQREQQHE